MAGRQQEITQTHFVGHLAEGLTTDQLRAGCGQESLTLALKMAVDDIADCCIENRVAQELQPLIVQRLSLVIATAHTLMQQSLLIVVDLTGVEPHDVIKRRKKLLLLAEREPDMVDNILKPHTS